MKISIIVLCFLFLNLSACEFFRSRSDSGELVRTLRTDSIRDACISDTLAINVFIKKSSKHDLDAYIKIVNYIPLETQEYALIGNVDKLIHYKDKIFILDRNIAKSIFIFKYDGTFVNKISKYGQESDEYKLLHDMELDTINHQIIVYDRNGGKFLFYDFNGNFVRIQKLGLRFSSFNLFPDGKYLFFTDNNYNNFSSDISNYSLLIGKPEGDIYFRALKNNSFLEQFNFSGKNNCFGANGKIYVCPRLSNAIYEIDSKGTLNKLYQIHLPSGSMADYVQMDPSFFLDEIATKRHYFSLGENILISDSLFHFNFVDPDRGMHSLWYNRNNGKSYCIDQEFSSSGRIIAAPFPLYLTNNKCFGIIDAADVVRCKSSFIKAQEKIQDKGKIAEQLLHKIDAIKESDNPLLMIYNIKWDK